MTKLTEGKVKQTVIQEQLVDSSSVTPNPAEGRDPWEYMASLNPHDWQGEGGGDHICYVYRMNNDNDRGEAVDKILHPFDEFFIRDKAGADNQGLGGGLYRLILKKGSQRVCDWRVRIGGEPRRPGDGGISGADTRSDVARILDALKQNDPQRFNNEVMMSTFKNSIEMMRASQPQQMNLKDLTEAMANLQRVQGGTASGTPPWLSKLGEALMPVVVGLVAKMIEPKDQLSVLKQMGEAITVLRGVSGNEPAEPSLTTELVRVGPSLLNGVSDILGKLRAAEELRMQRAALAAANGTAAAAPAGPHPGAIAPSQPQAPPAATPPVPGAPSPSNHEEFTAWIAANVVAMVKQGEDGSFVYGWLDVSDPESMKFLRDSKITVEQLDMLIATGQLHPKLMELTRLPNYKEWLAEFHTAVYASEPGVAAA